MHDTGQRSRARGCGVCGANLACVHRHTPRQTSNAPLNSSSGNLHLSPRQVGKYQKTTLLTLLLIKINNCSNFITQDSKESWKVTGCS